MTNTIALNANPLVRSIGKLSKDFTKADIIKYVEDNGIMMVDFHYIAGDRRLKTLNFVINDREYLDRILTLGERVDGSSLFGFMEAGKSDIYVLPRFSTAFLNPFKEEPTISFLCSYFHKSGEFLHNSAEYTLRKAIKSFEDATKGMEFWAMGELEYYVISQKEELFNAKDQKGYHESTPFAKFEMFRTEAMKLIAQCGGQIKYGHSEVGNFSLEGTYYEQNEIEFLPVPVLEAADQILLAKWILRTLAHERYGYNITFAPKITIGKAGSGMHIHTQIIKNGKNLYVKDGELSTEAKRTIAGFMLLAASITAFGNTNPTSYLRLVPNQEAPTTVCWGDRNRSTLVRVPLGWRTTLNMCHKANPLEPNTPGKFSDQQSIEFRASDGTSNIYLLLAALVIAAREGFEMPEKEAIKMADDTYVLGNIHKDNTEVATHHLVSLPASCAESAECLERMRAVYEKYDVFSKDLINATIAKLRSYNDANLRSELEKDPVKMAEIVETYFHC
ncbi:MAG: glutamine synthetase family protein [Bacteroidales bacterium]|jgi:glutamine synthetase|nr:glutamine synthetase family protein [Bacteroidales bacterium]